MVGDTLRNIFHVEIYALIGFIIFFTFFILVSINAFRMKKEEVDEISNMPLEDSVPTGNARHGA
ncbi:MAG TPA: CcoQ/FixQ family Cbb3-type cytochrome c oxidase assembly chaperone [Prolixibacteraceae bacterium]|nr:CcoQ/FixQ family Cbb3-type cytochrome c oxidase assembly chaperone [Prolixibacteraceae bacterium]